MSENPFKVDHDKGFKNENEWKLVEKAMKNNERLIKACSRRGSLEEIKRMFAMPPRKFVFFKDNINVNSTDKRGNTPLHYASQKEIAALLIAEGADVNARNINEETPLHRALTGNYGEIAELLIAKGANVHAVNKHGISPLYVASKYGCKEIVARLIAEGCDVNTVDKDGDTPLYIASYQGYTGIAELLITKGADINAANKKGDTPLHQALQNGHQEVAELLISKGANVNATNMQGKIPQFVPKRVFTKPECGHENYDCWSTGTCALCRSAELRHRCKKCGFEWESHICN
jgi:hypothetical protein